MLTFADASLDKLAAWRGEVSSPVEFRGAEEFSRLTREKRGALFIGSHLGNLEMIRALAATKQLATVTAVVYTDHARRFAATLAGANTRFADNLFEVRDFGPQTAILLKERVERGEILVIVGDRTPAADNGRRAHAPFLGHEAPFPQGPVVLGYLLGCPVYLFFCLKDGARYRIHLEPFAEKILLPQRERKAAIDAYVAQYARRLEWYCREAPLQCRGIAQARCDRSQHAPFAGGTTEGQTLIKHPDGMLQVPLREVQVAETTMGDDRCLPSAC